MYLRYLFFLFILPGLCFAQKEEQDNDLDIPLRVPAIIFEGDTMPYIMLPPATCLTTRKFKNKKEAAKWTRLLYNVKKVYPYSILAAARLKEYDRILAGIPNENDRKKYMKKVEKDLQDEFAEDLKNLTITQGRILIKLINRQTGKTTYDIIKEMRGSFSAFMWQSLATLFNSTLKDDYDAKGEDKAIENAIWLIENGYF